MRSHHCRGVLTREPGKPSVASTPTACLATSCLPPLVQQAHLRECWSSELPPLSTLPPHLSPLTLTGMYTFQVSLSEMSAQGTAEFWLSPTFDPSQSLLLAHTSVTTKVDPPTPASCVCVCVCVHVVRDIETLSTLQNRYYASSVSYQAL